MSKEEKGGSKANSNALIGTMITVTIAFVGVFSNQTISDIASEDRKLQIENNKNIADRAEKNRKDQIQIKMISDREIASSNMRVQMFKTLMERYFDENGTDKNSTLDTRIAILELIGLNFQNHLYLKPLFLQLNEELRHDYQKEKLRKTGRAINRFEINNIVGNGGTVNHLELELYEVEPYSNSGNDFYFQLLGITQDNIRITTNIEDKDGFEVTYFDTPFMDNSSNGDFTYSILLSDIDLKAKKATIKFVKFPTDYSNTRNKLYTDSKIANITKKDNGIVDTTKDNKTVDMTEKKSPHKIKGLIHVRE